MRAIRAPEFAFACSRTIEAMPFKKGAPMALNFRSILPSGLTSQFGAAHADDWTITAAAASLGLLVVAAIAVLMGMA
ncbi:MAG TPA: hypothetical protein VFL49_07085 [Pseudolabrys sp.]|nr:hypothetical protein [Pseudolabrys sp.]